MAKGSPKLIQNIFEARFERGYRYLDRCGDAMIILEEALPAKSNNSIWMPEEMRPTGARMKCPDLELTLTFDAYRLCLDQNPADVKCPFEDIGKYALDNVMSKFDIRKATRLGHRQLHILATDSIEDADNQSVKRAPFDNWLNPGVSDIKHKKSQVLVVWENDDRSKGVNFSMASAQKMEAPLRIDERLKKASHLLASGQREALIAQLKRQKQREKEPVAGLMIDIDYWWLSPEEPNIEEFFSSSNEQIQCLIKSFLEK